MLPVGPLFWKRFNLSTGLFELPASFPGASSESGAFGDGEKDLQT